MSSPAASERPSQAVKRGRHGGHFGIFSPTVGALRPKSSKRAKGARGRVNAGQTPESRTRLGSTMGCVAPARVRRAGVARMTCGSVPRGENRATPKHGLRGLLEPVPNSGAGARLVPAKAGAEVDRKALMREIRAFSKTIKLKRKLTLRDLRQAKEWGAPATLRTRGAGRRGPPDNRSGLSALSGSVPGWA